MPNWTIHILGGALLAGVLVWVLTQYASLSLGLDYATLAVVVFVYSQLPDIDCGSHISKLLSGIFLAGAIGSYLLYYEGLPQVPLYYAVIFAVLFVFSLVFKLTPHRGITHTVTLGLIFSLLIFSLGWWMVFFAFVAYWSHLLLDSFGHDEYYFVRLWGDWS
jgi:membrane-bound metal-dependent hydrolase YbcI (DUF457 family)